MRRQVRSRLSIIRDVLKCVKDEGKAPITRIMYGSRIPYDRLEPLLNELISKNILKRIENNGRKYYIITEKGNKLLNEIERFKNVLEKLGLEI
ncbi:MAG: winged helix-turn-helix domain-containing protein [Candidatus Methanomethylicia archaeon]